MGAAASGQTRKYAPCLILSKRERERNPNAKQAAAFSGAALEERVESYVQLMPWGAPDVYPEKVKKIDDLIDVGRAIMHFAHCGMRYDMAEASVRLFATEVLPELKKWNKWPYSEAAGNAGAERGDPKAWALLPPFRVMEDRASIGHPSRENT